MRNSRRLNSEYASWSISIIPVLAWRKSSPGDRLPVNDNRQFPTTAEDPMAQFIVEPHFRLQEWIAEEKGYFRDQGLDYEFRELIRSTEGQHHNKGGRGAFQSIEQGREANVSCACHWPVNVAASNGHTKLYSDVYSVAPSGIFVATDSKVRTPADLAGVPISGRFPCGSDYSTIQALESDMQGPNISDVFEDAMLFSRMVRLIDGRGQAAALFSGHYYLAQQLG